MNIDKVILFLFLLLIPFIGCNDDSNDEFLDYTGTWVNERNEMFKFDYTEGLVLYEDADTTILYTYALKKDSIYFYPGLSSDINDWTSYLLECNNNSFVLYSFQGIEKNIFVKK